MFSLHYTKDFSEMLIYGMFRCVCLSSKIGLFLVFSFWYSIVYTLLEMYYSITFALIRADKKHVFRKKGIMSLCKKRFQGGCHGRN